LERVLAVRREGSDAYRVRAEVLEREIQALALLAENKRDEAVGLLRDAAAKEQAMPIEFGPPFVDKPAAELLGDVLLAMGRATDAAATPRNMYGRA
jgi:hypothetical protein